MRIGGLPARRSRVLAPLGAALVTLALAAMATGSTAGGWAESAPTLTRKQADAIALRVLRPQAVKGEVILFGLPAPLPKETVVEPADPPTGAPGRKVRRRVTPLASPAWLYWLDRDAYARFSHDSEYLLVDDRSRRVVRRARIGWYPTVNANDPPFVATTAGYEAARYRVYSRVTPVSRSGAAAKRVAEVVLPAGAFADDCVLMFGDYRAAVTRNDFPAVKELAGSLGLRDFYTTAGGPKQAPEGRAPDATHLRANVKTLVDVERCRDILIYMSGPPAEPRRPPSRRSEARTPSPTTSTRRERRSSARPTRQTARATPSAGGWDGTDGA